MLPLVVLFVGVFVGILFSRISPPLLKKIKEYNMMILLFSIVMLIFAMGINVGIIPDLPNLLTTIGIESITFTILTSLGSMIVVSYVGKYLLRDK